MQELLNKKILIVDDEKPLLDMLSNILWREGFYNLHTASDCASAMKIAMEHPISLYLLDVRLPDGDGFTLFEDLRKISRSAQTPVIFLTACDENSDRIRGLGLGADDYIVKPFLTEELILRVRSVLRRVYAIGGDVPAFTLSGVTVNLETASLTKNGREITLTAKEYLLLKKLWENKNKIVTNDALCMAAWGEDYYGCENTLMVHIRRLRKKIELQPSSPRHLVTVKGLGYKLLL